MEQADVQKKLERGFWILLVTANTPSVDLLWILGHTQVIRLQ
jgi:hypothetical protein